VKSQSAVSLPRWRWHSRACRKTVHYWNVPHGFPTCVMPTG